MIGLIIIAVFSYTIAAGVIYNLLVHLGVGVDHYETIDDSTIGAVVLSAFWPITGIGLAGFAIGTLIFNSTIKKDK